MATNAKTVSVPVMTLNDYRDPRTFDRMGSRWGNVLARWNDPNITAYEAKGILHHLVDDLAMIPEAPARLGEDSRETRVRFLLHYAKLTATSEHVEQIIRKARKVLITKVLGSRYMEYDAPYSLIVDVFTFFENNAFQTWCGNPERRKLAVFLRAIHEKNLSPELHTRNERLAQLLFLREDLM